MIDVKSRVILNLSHDTKIKYKKYLEIIFNVIEEDSIVIDLNYFPELEPSNIGRIIRSFFMRRKLCF